MVLSGMVGVTQYSCVAASVMSPFLDDSNFWLNQNDPCHNDCTCQVNQPHPYFCPCVCFLEDFWVWFGCSVHSQMLVAVDDVYSTNC